MKKILVVVDMQNDFITGPLGTPEAVSIVDKVVEKIRGEEWDYILDTMDTHDGNYLNSTEGRKLPIVHCIENSRGWELNDKVRSALNDIDGFSIKCGTYLKDSFSDYMFIEFMKHLTGILYGQESEFELTIVGVCTDICVISNALLLKAHYPEMKIVVDASCCAGSTPEKHRMALEVMKSCQVDVVNDESERDWFIVPSVSEYFSRVNVISSEEIRQAMSLAESEDA